MQSKSLFEKVTAAATTPAHLTVAPAALAISPANVGMSLPFTPFAPGSSWNAPATPSHLLPFQTVPGSSWGSYSSTATRKPQFTPFAPGSSWNAPPPAPSNMHLPFTPFAPGSSWNAPAQNPDWDQSTIDPDWRAQALRRQGRTDKREEKRLRHAQEEALADARSQVNPAAAALVNAHVTRGAPSTVAME